MLALLRLIPRLPVPSFGGHAVLTACSPNGTDVANCLSSNFVTPMFGYVQLLLPVAVILFFLHRLMNETGQGWRSVLVEIVVIAGGSELVLLVVKAIFGL
jgi:hypothetical protein